ncbi:helix-turn-helix transcriptional regulator, partial [Sphingobium sp.]|uniref:helix-turn-helix transcriptional regulator n=1 Tax=Sphingobium sp. TaxID=1912891 RepID=UPI0028BEC2FA
AALEISVNTVGSHVKQIYRKLAVSSRGEAVFEALQRGLITDLPGGPARPSGSTQPGSRCSRNILARTSMPNMVPAPP